MKPYTAMARVSTPSQAKKHGIALQLAAIQVYATKEKLRLQDEYIDKLSGRIETREAYDRLITNAALYRGVIIYDLRRLARSEELGHRFLRELNEAGLEVHDTHRGGLVTADVRTGIDIVFAAEEWRVTRKRTQAGLLQVAEKGLLPNGILLYGYRNLLGQNKAVINETEAEIVRKIYKYSSEGMPYMSIAKTLNEERIPTPKNTGTWYQQTVRRMILKTAYKGDYRWQHSTKTYIIKIPAIVSPDLWKRAQKRFTPPVSKLGFALTGRIRCGLCGYALSAKMHRQKFAQYRCNGSLHADGCKIGLINRDKLDNAVEAELRRVLSDENEMLKYYKEHERMNQVDHTPDIENKENEINRILEMAKRGLISIDDAEHDVNRLKIQISNLLKPIEFSYDLDKYIHLAEEASFVDLLSITNARVTVFSKTEFALSITP